MIAVELTQILSLRKPFKRYIYRIADIHHRFDLQPQETHNWIFHLPVRQLVIEVFKVAQFLDRNMK